MLRRQRPGHRRAAGAGSLAELGSGSGKKTRVLLAAACAGPTSYLPIDVSGDAGSLHLVAAGRVAELVVTPYGALQADLEWMRANLGADCRPGRW